MYDLCVFYSNKIKFKDDFASLSLLLMDEIEGDSQNRTSKEVEEAKKGGKHTKSELNDKMMHKQMKSLDSDDTFSSISKKNKYNNQLIEKASLEIRERRMRESGSKRAQSHASGT